MLLNIIQKAPPCCMCLQHPTLEMKSSLKWSAILLEPLQAQVGFLPTDPCGVQTLLGRQVLSPSFMISSRQALWYTRVLMERSNGKLHLKTGTTWEITFETSYTQLVSSASFHAGLRRIEHTILLEFQSPKTGVIHPNSLIPSGTLKKAKHNIGSVTHIH